MGAAGKNLRGHGQHRNATSPPAQLKDSAYGRPPHPQTVRPGQIYWPRSGRRRRSFRVTRTLGDGTVRGRRTDGTNESLVVSAERLLAITDDGSGEHYSFLGWTSRRYSTWARIAAHDPEAGELILIVPEWHPKYPIRILERLVPFPLPELGGWIRSVADLSAAYPARLALVLVRLCDDPGRVVYFPSATPQSA
jgi:hypothetical protein